MLDKEENLQSVLHDVFMLDDPKIDSSRKEQLHDFIESTINGDALQDHLAINANLDKNHQGALLYILTNFRFIQVEIDQKETISSSFPLDTIVGIERKMTDGERTQVKILFNNDSFGLRYPSDDKKISTFFQKVEQSRSRGNLNG